MTTPAQFAQAPPVGRYRIDPASSEIAITAKHLFGLATVRARMSILTGELVVADDITASQVTVTVSATSFDSGDARRDRAVAATKFLAVQRHPSMTFLSTAVRQDGEHWVVAGVLTAHGVDAPLSWTVSDVVPDATGLTLHASARVDRYAHGITAMRGMAGRFIDVRITARALAHSSTDND